MLARRLCFVLGGLLAFILLTGGGVALYLKHYLQTPLALSTSQVIEVKPGMGFSQLARKLHRDKLIGYPKWFSLYAVVSGQSGHLQSGEYALEPGITPLALLEKMTAGDVVTYQITFIEGWRFSQWLSEFDEHPKILRKLEDSSTSQIMAELQQEAEHPEGRFFAAGYSYTAGTSDRDILARAYARLQEVLTEEWERRAPSLPYESPDEALIMASIIEKETAVPEERAKIAGVFVRRLLRGMRLQTDPTVIYGLGDTFDGDLRRRHLKQDTPYNTYVIKGLPPTPIATVGRDSIHAALNPEPGTSLYFVARGDGTHTFSDTLAQHNAAVKQYQIQRRAKNYRSTPGK